MTGFIAITRKTANQSNFCNKKSPFRAEVLSIPLGLLLGIIAAVKKNKWQDHLISTGVMIIVSVPSFIYGFLVQYFLCFKLGWFKPIFDASKGAFSWAAFKTYIPAILCLSFGSIAGYARTLRAELSEISQKILK